MKLYSLQVLRFWAAFGVVYFHAANVAHKLTGDWGVAGQAGALLGRAGVDLFFVLSGVVITLTARHSTARAFIARRVKRVWPIYLVATLPFALLAGGELGWRDLLVSGFLWPATDTMTAPLLPVGWTLCFEALFYWSMAVVIWRPKALPWLLAIYGGCLTVRAGPVTQFVGNPMVLEFLLGAALTFLPRWKPAAWALPVGLAILVFAAPQWVTDGSVPGLLRGTQAWSRVLLMGLPAGLIVWGALQIETKPGVFTYLGDASYSLYLFHPLVMYALTVAFKLSALRWEPNLLIALSATLSLLICWRVHDLVERPLLAFVKRPLFARPAAA